MTTKEDLMKQMLPEIKKIVRAWNSNGIIIESQFVFADHLNIKKHCVELYEILVDYGGKCVTSLESKDDIHAFVTGDYVPDEGVMYCLFNPDVLTLSEVKNAIQEYFEHKHS